MVIWGGLRSAHCRSARLRTLTAQRFGVAEAPLQGRGDWRLALPVEVGMAVGEGGGGEEGEGEDGRGGEVHGGLWGWLGGWLVIVVGLEDWLRRWWWMCGTNVGFPLFFMVVCSGGFCIGLAVASIVGDAMTIVGIHSSSSSTAATNVLEAFWLWSCFLPSFDAGVSAEMRNGCWMVVI